MANATLKTKEVYNNMVIMEIETRYNMTYYKITVVDKIDGRTKAGNVYKEENQAKRAFYYYTKKAAYME